MIWLVRALGIEQVRGAFAGRDALRNFDDDLSFLLWRPVSSAPFNRGNLWRFGRSGRFCFCCHDFCTTTSRAIILQHGSVGNPSRSSGRNKAVIDVMPRRAERKLNAGRRGNLFIQGSVIPSRRSRRNSKKSCEKWACRDHRDIPNCSRELKRWWCKFFFGFSEIS